jgi:hypothetical protein
MRSEILPSHILQTFLNILTTNPHTQRITQPIRSTLLMSKPKKPKGLDKVPEDETFFDYAYRTFQTKFVQALPMGAIRELPSTYMFFFGTFAYIFSLSCFVYFVVTGYNAALASKFVSISNDAGKCLHVLRPVIGTFTADNRYWDSKPDYDPSFGRYVLELNEYEDQLQGYKSTMTKVGQELLDLGNRAKNLSLAQNILLWTTWQTTLDYSKSVNIFYMTGDPKIIYDRELNLGLFASISGDCLVPASASFVEVLKFSLLLVLLITLFLCRLSLSENFLLSHLHLPLRRTQYVISLPPWRCSYTTSITTTMILKSILIPAQLR